jgi:hypothetical protein
VGKPFLKDLNGIQPSQLYISSEKLERACAYLASTAEEMEPLPIKTLAGCEVFTDGHTRAFAAFRQGLVKIPVFWDEDDLDWEAYEICVEWCREAGIRTIADLEGRVISPDDYEVMWLQRCEKMQRELESRRSKG